MDQANYADALVFMALHSDFTVFAVCAFFLWRKGETFNVMIFAASIIIFLEPQPLHIYAGKAWRLKKKTTLPQTPRSAGSLRHWVRPFFYHYISMPHIAVSNLRQICGIEI
jgi:hypothetical protein